MTPTFSWGSVLRTTLLTQSAEWARAKPTRVGSATLMRALSTPYTWTQSTPRRCRSGDGVGVEESVKEAAVAVGRESDAVLRVQQDPPLSIQRRQLPLLEERHVGGRKAEVPVRREEGHGGVVRDDRRHDVPGKGDVGEGHGGLAGGQVAQAVDAVGLQVEEALAGGEADVEAALGVGGAQAGALPAGHEDDGDAALGDGA